MRAQGLIERRQVIEVEQADERAEGQAAHEQREERHASGLDADEALDLVRDGVVLRDGERERQRHRTAQAAPQNHDVVAQTHSLRQTHGAHDWQEHEQHERARDERRDDRERDEPHVVPADVADEVWHEQRREHENQRAGPVAELLSDVVEELPVARRDPGRSRRAHDQAGRYGRDHARNAKRTLADDEHQYARASA